MGCASAVVGVGERRRSTTHQPQLGERGRRKIKKLGFLVWALRFYTVGGVLWAGLHVLLGLKFKMGRIYLIGSILCRAQPKWAKFGEIRAFRAESQNCVYSIHLSH
jgi:hypothetical protein